MAWRERAGDYARTALSTITTEYPNDLRHLITGPDDRPTPRGIHPAFYGSFDWHSCVEMHWALARLLRLAPDRVPVDEIRAVLSAHLIPGALDKETQYLVDHPGFSRPYGRGWVLALVHELHQADDPFAQQWAAAALPLGEAVAANFVAWLPKLTYPVRYGFHNNTAFALCRALPYARMRQASGLAEEIEAAARRWFADDADYPARWEPGGSDFLSPALTEAELMAAVLPAGEFAAWFDAFLPAVPAMPALPPSLTTPAIVSDPTDGQLAHLPGLNYSRAASLKRIAAVLPDRTDLLDVAARHDEAAVPYATGGDYMTEHWLVAYAVLSLS